jgi:zinc transport system ATP-binding protein
MSAVVDGTLLQVRELVAGYDRPVVGPLSFSVARGEVLGLWGANGAGKSTLLHAIADGARCFQGRIERAPGLRLAYQEQQPTRLQALPLTGNELLRIAGAAQQDLPASLAATVGKRIDRLSGGQYQLLRVWAALAGGADLLLLDEPTNNLDPTHEGLLADMLRTRSADCAVLLVSHERAFIDATCSRVLELGR